MERMKHIGMFIAAPFISLAYVIVLPIYGFAQLLTIAHEAYKKR